MLLTCDLLGHPQTSTRFQDPGFRAVHQKEGVVVAKGSRILPAWATLSMLLQEACDNSQGRPGAVATLQAKSDEEKSAQITPKTTTAVCYTADQRLLCRYSPDKVHAQQSLFSVHRLPGPNSLVAYTDSPIVGSHFSPPHPGRLTENDGVGVLLLWDLDVCALQTERSELSWSRVQH